MQKLKLYGNDSSQSQSSTRDGKILLGLRGRVVKCVREVKPETGKLHSSYNWYVYVVPPMRMGV